MRAALPALLLIAACTRAPALVPAPADSVAPPAAAAAPTLERVLFPPGIEPVRYDPGTPVERPSFGPLVPAFDLDPLPAAATPVAALLPVESRWVCSPAGAGLPSRCGVIQVTHGALP